MIFAIDPARPCHASQPDRHVLWTFVQKLSCRVNSSPLRELAVTYFILLAGTARTGLVTPDLGLLSYHLLHGGDFGLLFLTTGNGGMLIVHGVLPLPLRFQGIDVFLLPDLHARD